MIMILLQRISLKFSLKVAFFFSIFADYLFGSFVKASNKIVMKVTSDMILKVHLQPTKLLISKLVCENETPK